ncbi:MAG: hypothetical protein WC736_15940 [Gallionella sp.]|jgi:hypothetical protein
MRYLLLVVLVAGVGTAWGGWQTPTEVGTTGETRTLECREWECGNPHSWSDNMAPAKCTRTPEYFELLSAAEGVLPYLDAPSDDRMKLTMTYPVYTPPPTELELAQKRVEELRAKDAAIKRFHDAVKKAKGE